VAALEGAPPHRIILALVVVGDVSAGGRLGDVARFGAAVVFDESVLGVASRGDGTKVVVVAVHAHVGEGLAGVFGEVDVVVGRRVHDDAAQDVLMSLRERVRVHGAEAEAHREDSLNIDAQL
jgi:hypothetical protein